MKVRELIAALTALPPEAADLEVYVWDAGDRLTLVDLDDSFLNDEHPFVDLNTNTDHQRRKQMRTKTNWNERAVMALYYLAHMVEGVLYICSLGYIRTNLGGDILFSDWATDFTDKGESK